MGKAFKAPQLVKVIIGLMILSLQGRFWFSGSRNPKISFDPSSTLPLPGPMSSCLEVGCVSAVLGAAAAKAKQLD